MLLSRLSIFLTGIDLKKGSNGLGPNNFGYWRILIPYQKLFYYEALNHDIEYCIGGSEKDKVFADKRFYLGCINKSKNTLQFILASLYYLGVKNIGNRFFNYH